MPGFIVMLLASGVFSKRIDIIVDRGKLAPSNAFYLLGTFLASWLGPVNILWGFLEVHWPFPVAGLVLGLLLSLPVRVDYVARLIPVKTVLDAGIVGSAFYLWIEYWPFRWHF